MANRKEPRTSTAKSAQGSEQINQTREDNDIWQIPVRSRPHTVAAVRVQNDSLDMKKTCVNTKLLCGCKSRQPAPESKRLAASPLNDVNDLLCGIQSVEITVKQNSKNDLTSWTNKFTKLWKLILILLHHSLLECINEIIDFNLNTVYDVLYIQ